MILTLASLFSFNSRSTRGFDIARFKESGAEFHRELAARTLQADLDLTRVISRKKEKERERKRDATVAISDRKRSDL